MRELRILDNKSPIIEGLHYYLENGKVVYTRYHHMLRSYCCGKQCRHCPYDPVHKKWTKKIKEENTQE